jgi:hypothetical protein
MNIEKLSKKLVTRQLAKKLIAFFYWIKPKGERMNTKKKTQKKIKYQVERVYVGEKPMNEVFEGIIEHVVDENIKNEELNKKHA